MCCRYYFASDQPDARVRKILSLMERDYPGAYKTGEIFPGDTAVALIGENGRLRHVPAVFGFPGVKGGRLLLNARAETVALKPTFAAAFRAQRAILPADGFYEWTHDAQKTKYLFTLENLRTVYLCGLYKVVDGAFRFVILTRAANASMAGVHDRMPVIASAEQVRPYLTDPVAAASIAAAPGPLLLRAPAVSPAERFAAPQEDLFTP